MRKAVRCRATWAPAYHAKFGNLAVLLALGCVGMDLIVVQGAADQAVMQGGAAARHAPPIMPRR